MGACLGNSKSKKLYLEVPQGSRDSASWGKLCSPQFGKNRNECVYLMGHLKVSQKEAKHGPSQKEPCLKGLSEEMRTSSVSSGPLETSSLRVES